MSTESTTGNTWTPLTLNVCTNSTAWIGLNAMNATTYEPAARGVRPARQNRKARRRARALERGRR